LAAFDRDSGVDLVDAVNRGRSGQQPALGQGELFVAEGAHLVQLGQAPELGYQIARRVFDDSRRRRSHATSLALSPIMLRPRFAVMGTLVVTIRELS